MLRKTAIASAAFCTLLSLSPAVHATDAAPAPSVSAPPAAFDPSRASLLFEENRGQAESHTKFLAHTSHGILRFAEDAVELPCSAGQPPLTLSIAGSQGRFTLNADRPSGGVANYYLGRNSSQWIQGIPLQQRVSYHSPDQGVALIFHGVGEALEYDLQVNQGSEPSGVALRPSPGAHFEVEADGSATLRSLPARGCQPLRFHAPAAFQQMGQNRISIPSSFALNSAGELSFSVSKYDHHAPLTIDPVVSYTTGVSANNGTAVSAVQVDTAGDLFVTGQTYASNYPVAGGGAQGIGSTASEQVYVSEFDPTGTKLLYSTYLPAADFNTSAALALDAAGNAYVTGVTGASSFPTTSQNLGTCDSFCNTGFVVKLSTTGTILYSTLLGSSQQLPKSIVVDANGSAYVAGLSTGPGLQTVNAFQAAYTGEQCTSCTAPFFGKLNPAGTQWLFSSYFSTFGSDETFATSIALDSTGNIYLAGNGTSVPLKHSFQAAIGGSFVAEFAPDGQSLLFSTLLGGYTIVPDAIGGMQVGSDGTIFVAGSQIAEDFPYTVSAYRHPTYPIGYAEARSYIFGTAINPQRTGYSWSTYLGQGSVYSTALDASGNFYVGGTFSAGTIPFQNAVASGIGSGAYLLELDATGALQFATGLGGINESQVPSSIAVDAAGGIYVAGTLGGADNSVSTVLDAINVGTGPAYAPQVALGLNPIAGYAFFAAKIIPDTRTQISLSPSGPVLALRNAGSADLHIGSIVPSSGISSIISTCGSTLAAGSACYLTPISSTPSGNTITINSDAQPASQTFSPQDLSANPGAQLIIDGSQLILPPQQNGTSAPGKPLIITNAGSAPATVTSILTFGEFRQTSDCGTPLQPGTSCTAIVSVLPTSAGSGSGDIGVVLGNGTRDDIYATFSQNSADGPLLLSTDTYGSVFGNVLIGTTSLLRTITVTNSGQAPVTVADPTLSGGNADDFTLAANTCAGIMLQPQASCVLGYTFTPSSSDHLYTTVQVTGGGSSLQTGLSGTGVTPPSLTVNPTALNFGQLAIGGTASSSLQLTNTGTTAIPLTDLRISLPAGATQTDFSETTNCAASLSAQASCTVTVTFSPSGAGVRSGDLSILLNGGIASQDIQLSGTGSASVAPVITFAIPNQLFGTAPFTLSASSNSSAALTYSVVSGRATLSGGTLTVTGVGPVVVQASQPAIQGFQAAVATATFTVAQATSQSSWVTPAELSYGAALSSAQLDASATIPGNFTYTPPAGTVLNAGNQTLSVTFTPQDTADYATTTAAVTLVVNKASPQITWPAPAAITYGAALSAQQLNASTTVPGNFTYTPAAGSVPLAGAVVLSATFSPTDMANYTPASANANLNVGPAPLTVIAASATRTYGSANPSLTATLNGTANGDTLAASADTAATTLSNTGTYTIVPHVTGANLSNYTVTPVNGTLTITQAESNTTTSSGSATSPTGASVSFTATVTSLTSGTPTGVVEFQLNGGPTLASVPLSSGTATFTTSSLAPGANNITAIYNGDSNFKNSQSTQLTETVVVPDFSIAVTPEALSIKRGESGTATFTVTPVNGFAQAVTLDCGNLPAGVSCSFAPAAITPSGGPASSVLTVTAEPQTAASLTSPETKGNQPQRGPGLARWGFMACLLPLLTLRRRGRIAGLLGLLVLCGLTALSGCGGNAPNLTGGAPLGAASLTVTASSYGATNGVQHAANLTITITQ